MALGSCSYVFTRLDAAGVLAIGDIAGGFEKISRAMLHVCVHLSTHSISRLGREGSPSSIPPVPYTLRTTVHSHTVSPLSVPCRALGYGYLRGVYVTRGTVGRRATAQCAHLSLAGTGCLSVAVAASRRCSTCDLVRPARSRQWLPSARTFFTLAPSYDRRSESRPQPGANESLHEVLQSRTLLGPSSTHDRGTDADRPLGEHGCMDRCGPRVKLVNTRL